MFSLKLFGGASIETSAGPLTGRAVQRHRLALLGLLAASPAGVSRDRLIAYLWPESSAEKGRRLLSDSVYRINHAVGAEAIFAAGDELRLDARRLPSDAAAFRAAVAAKAWEEAVAAYTGTFLDGLFLPDAGEFERWVETERAGFEREYAAALEALAEAAEAGGDHARAAGWWRARAARDACNTRVALRLMRALAAAGERAAALQHARTHTVLLRETFGAEPDAEIVALAERLRTEPAPRAASAGPAAPEPAGATMPPPAPPPAPTMANGTGAGAAGAAVPPETPEIPDTPRAPVPAARRRAPRGYLVLAAALALLVAFGAWRLWPRGPAPVAASAAVTTLAVLPFTDRSEERAQGYFADGITEELIATLSQVDGLRLVSSRSAFAYRNSSEDVREIGRELGAAAVLEGSVRSAGDRLRINAQLVSVSDGYQLWSETYDRTAGDAFTIQEEIARAIAQTLRARFAGGRRERAPPDPRAYELYLEGRGALIRARFDRTATAPEGYLVPLRLHEQAVARDSNFAEAYAEMAGALVSLAYLEYMPPGEAFPRAEAAARRALALDPTLGRAHMNLAYVELYYRWNLARAEDSFRRAIALAPGERIAHQWYANLLTADGRFAAALREIRLAQDADPLAVIAIAAEGWVHYHAGDYPAALEACRRALALNPEHGLAHLWRAWALERMDSLPAALAAHRRAVASSDSGAVFVTALAGAHARAGERGQAEALLGWLAARDARGEHVPPYDVAKAYVALGRHDDAFAWLERALAQRSHSLVLMRVDPQLVALRADPRYVHLLERVFGAAADP